MPKRRYYGYYRGRRQYRLRYVTPTSLVGLVVIAVIVVALVFIISFPIVTLLLIVGGLVSWGAWIIIQDQLNDARKRKSQAQEQKRINTAAANASAYEAAYQWRVRNRPYKKVDGFWVPNTPEQNATSKSEDNQTT